MRGRRPEPGIRSTGSRDFGAYLDFLAVDCERACGATSAARPAVLAWGNRTVDEFLLGWARLLGPRAGHGIAVPEEAPGEPGWRGLARLVDAARTASPDDDRGPTGSGIARDDVVSAQDLRGYLGAQRPVRLAGRLVVVGRGRRAGPRPARTGHLALHRLQLGAAQGYE
ncbi:hypothetical protein AQI95_32110 [Streptomyces yokosukanensis]|uniref:Uncharacterized protein n=1 Tax=Streptomyces yokosukanensis TaxID=67386 RepID=A0A117Q0I6_9ACTN|nr:hypothetical protein AQI95_32110 [Streptomyces yokosukanensis]